MALNAIINNTPKSQERNTIFRYSFQSAKKSEATKELTHWFSFKLASKPSKAREMPKGGRENENIFVYLERFFYFFFIFCNTDRENNFMNVNSMHTI